MSKEKEFLKELGVYVAICYIAGFILWNFYLSRFGYFEYNLLQTRFISAGLASLLIPLLVIDRVEKLKTWILSQKVSSIILLFLAYVFIFGYSIFPHIPQYLGGAQPFVVSVLGNEEQIGYLKQFNWQIYPDSKIQMLPACQIYSNEKAEILWISYYDDLKLLPDGELQVTLPPKNQRLIILNKNEMKGIQPVTEETAIGRTCADFTKFGWSQKFKLMWSILNRD